MTVLMSECLGVQSELTVVEAPEPPQALRLNMTAEATHRMLALLMMVFMMPF
ncbi:hypothetical protein [Nocardioides cavernaquae]|uniref:hypothetical protein n=1 Tax=Nocardioides cavernaquae TaxID=2321396 RepID=UPI001C7D6A84|nr:hypothetical protein [Nocardioides cavernaquae]